MTGGQDERQARMEERRGARDDSSSPDGSAHGHGGADGPGRARGTSPPPKRRRTPHGDPPSDHGRRYDPARADRRAALQTGEVGSEYESESGFGREESSS